MQFLETLKKTQLALMVALAFGFALPASAGGVFEAPDGVANPSGSDYTGFYPVAYFFGIRDNATQRTVISCVNVGGIGADAVAYQYFGVSDVPGTNPTGDLSGPGWELPPTDIDTASSTSSSLSGSVTDFGIARVIAMDAVRKRNASIYCQAMIEDIATNRTVAVLESWTPPARKKKRR